MPLATYKGLGGLSNQVEFLSTASTALTLTQDQQGKLLLYGGQTSASRINLPAPAAGMVYRLFFTGAGGVTTAHKILSSGSYDILVAATTGKGVANETTAQTGVGIELMAINEFRWVASRFGGSTLNINSTST